MRFSSQILSGFYTVFKKLFATKATIKYPKQLNPKSSLFRGAHIYCAEKCINCMRCVNSCPNGCIIIKSNTCIIDYSKCCFCSICTKNCPTKAITFGGSEISPTCSKSHLHINLKENT